MIQNVRLFIVTLGSPLLLSSCKVEIKQMTPFGGACRQAITAAASLSTEPTRENILACSDYSQYAFEETQFGSEFLVRDVPEQFSVERCLNFLGENICVSTTRLEFSTRQAAESDTHYADNKASYNYLEYRVSLRDPSDSNRFLDSQSGDSLREALSKAIARCQELSGENL